MGPSSRASRTGSGGGLRRSKHRLDRHRGPARPGGPLDASLAGHRVEPDRPDARHHRAGGDGRAATDPRHQPSPAGSGARSRGPVGRSGRRDQHDPVDPGLRLSGRPPDQQAALLEADLLQRRTLRRDAGHGRAADPGRDRRPPPAGSWPPGGGCADDRPCGERGSALPDLLQERVSRDRGRDRHVLPAARHHLAPARLDRARFGGAICVRGPVAGPGAAGFSDTGKRVQRGHDQDGWGQPLLLVEPGHALRPRLAGGAPARDRSGGPYGGRPSDPRHRPGPVQDRLRRRLQDLAGASGARLRTHVLAGGRGRAGHPGAVGRGSDLRLCHAGPVARLPSPAGSADAAAGPDSARVAGRLASGRHGLRRRHVPALAQHVLRLRDDGDAGCRCLRAVARSGRAAAAG